MARPEVPDFLTVEEAARVLRIGRTAAYALARQWRATDGRQGLPVVAMGRLLRVPRAALEEISGGPLTSGQPPARADEPKRRPDPDRVVVARPTSTQPRHTRTRHPRRPSPDQTTLPFTN